jgi:hypothetical protein
MPHDFNTAGTINIVAIYTSTNGVTQSGNFTVKVVEHNFSGNPAGWVGMDRNWDVVLPPEATFEADTRLFIEAIAPLAGGGWRNSLIVDTSEPRYFVTHLGTNGPVLSSGAAKGFKLWHGADTYTQAITTYADGSELVEMMLVIHPVLPDVIIQMDVIVGGVIFIDGTITKTLTAADFDSQGRCFIRFIRPASAKTSVCHSIRIWQGTSLIGVVR